MAVHARSGDERSISMSVDVTVTRFDVASSADVTPALQDLNLIAMKVSDHALKSGSLRAHTSEGTAASNTRPADATP